MPGPLLAIGLLWLVGFCARVVHATDERNGRLSTLRESRTSPGTWSPTAAPSLDGSPVEYLVLTSATMAPEFERLAGWKTRKGVPAVVRTIDDVLATQVQGVDLAETIRNYIRDAYLLWGVRFVLLAGDTDVIPARTARLEFLGLSDPVTDLYYSCLDGTWNADGDAFFGEAYSDPTDPGDDADLLSEVYLGRAPVSTLEEAQVFVDKSLRLDNPPVTDHLDRMLMLSEVLFPAKYVDTGAPPSGDGAIYSEEIDAIAPAGMQVQRYYEAAPYWPGSVLLTAASALQEISAGYGTVLHIGHGYRYTLSMGDASVDVGDAAALDNGVRAGLFYLLNCTATAFDFESMAEALLLNPQGGAAAVVGAAREAFPAAARDYQLAFFQQLYQANERRIGVAMTESRHLFVDGAALPTVDRWTQLVYTLLGDPEAPVWTRADSLQVLGVPSSVAVGGTTLALEVRDAMGPVSNALVAAWKPEDAYVYGRTDASGQVTLDVEAAASGTLTLTVTAVDHLPRELEIPVSAGDIALVVSDVGLQDDGGTLGFGNVDGRADAGETVRLHLPLSNLGTVAATNITATLSSSDPLVTVLQGNSSWTALGAGIEADAEVPFEVRLSPELADGCTVTLELSLQHDAGTEVRHVPLQVHAARLVWGALRLDDSRAGNGNGVQEAGEEIDLHYSLRNRGSGRAEQVHLVLLSPDAGLQVLRDSTVALSIAPGQERELSALTLLEPDVSVSRSVDLLLQHLQLPAGRLRTLEMRLPGMPTELSALPPDAPDAVLLKWQAPADTDVAGYEVERALQESGPWQVVNADLLLHARYRDVGLPGSTRFWYRVRAFDTALLPGPWSLPVAVSTNPPQLSGWPLQTGDFTASSPVIGDLDADGDAEILAAADDLLAWHGNGIEVLDADGNALTWGVFAGHGEVYGPVALADLDAVPGKELVAATWDDVRRFVTVVGATGEPLPGWPQALQPSGPAGAQVAPVIANIDQQGAPEILLMARDGRIYAWHVDGSEVVDGDSDPTTNGVFYDTGNAFLRCAPGVADLDPSRPGLEIAFGTSFDGRFFVLDAQGQPLPGWPRSVGGDGEAFGQTFASGVTIGDVDGDATLEMVFLESGQKLHVMHLDGSELAGFPVGGMKSFGLSLTPSPALADLQGDAQLEIVACSSDGNVHLIDAQGNELPGSPFVSGASSESSPLIGDLDDDPQLEILFGNESGSLQAWNLDGSPVDGFPIVYNSEVRATPSLGDVDGDGTTDLVVQTWNGDVHVLGLGVPWAEERYPWPTYRGNPHRTGEFGFDVPTPVAVSEVLGTYVPTRGVRVSWRAASDAGDERDVLWRLWRAGPFREEPLDVGVDPSYNKEPLGEIRGSGRLAFVDADVERGSWYVYRLELEESLGSGGSAPVRVATLSVQAGTLPSALRLLANVPNPFNPATRIGFEIPEGRGSADRSVRLQIFDVQGRRVRTLIARPLRAGVHDVMWEGRDDSGAAVASGVYIARLQFAGRSVRRKLMLLR